MCECGAVGWYFMGLLYCSECDDTFLRLIWMDDNAEG